MPMTRAEGVCVCTNLIELIEELDDILPNKFATELSEKATDIRKTLRERAQLSHLSVKQDSALRNMWGGVRRWDHKDQGNDDMFWGLSDVIMELADVDVDAPPPVAPSSMDEGMDLPEIPDNVADKGAQRLAAYEAKQQKEAPKPTTTRVATESVSTRVETKTRTVRVGAQVEDIAREREAQVTEALQRFHADGIEVVDKKHVQHGALAAILKMTTSIRTQQLIRAAYHTGVVRGAHNVADALIKRAQ